MRRLRAWLVTTPRGPRVTDRPYYGGPPSSGLTAIRRAGAKPPVLLDLETDLAGRRCFSPGSKHRRGGAPRGGRPAQTLRRLRKLVCGARDVRRDVSRLRAYVI